MQLQYHILSLGFLSWVNMDTGPIVVLGLFSIAIAEYLRLGKFTKKDNLS